MSLTSLTPEPGDTVQIDVGYSKPKPGPYYITMGDKGMRYHKETNSSFFGFDPIPVFKQLSLNATRFWWELVSIRNNDTNVAVIRGKNVSQYTKNQMSKAYKELSSFGLVHRYKREHFLINPNAMLPNSINKYLDVANVWNSYRKMYPINLAIQTPKPSQTLPLQRIRPRAHQ